MYFNDDDDDDYDEDITGLIAKPPVKYVIPPMYMSKYRESIQSSASNGKCAHKSLGVPRVSLNPPTQFLRKNSRIDVKHTDVNHKHYRRPDYQHKLPAWEPIRLSKSSDKPSEDSEKPTKPLKNFKEENIIKVRTSEAKKPQLYYIDDKRGNSFPPKPNGVYPVPKKSKDPDQHPSGNKAAALTEKKRTGEKKTNPKQRQRLASGTGAASRDIAGKTSSKTEKSVAKSPSEASESKVKTPMSKDASKGQRMCRYVSEDERAELLHGMKKKWDEMMKQFQGLPFLTDTPPKVKRKAKMEEDLKQLEKDIELIERHPYIYVYSDGEDDR